MSGFALVEALRSRRTVAALFMSADVLRAPANAVLLAKPFTVAELDVELKRLLKL